MHTTQVARPFHTKGWVYGEKYDWVRMVAYKDDGRITLEAQPWRSSCLSSATTPQWLLRATPVRHFRLQRAWPGHTALRVTPYPQ